MVTIAAWATYVHTGDRSFFIRSSTRSYVKPGSVNTNRVFYCSGKNQDHEVFNYRTGATCFVHVVRPAATQKRNKVKGSL